MQDAPIGVNVDDFRLTLKKALRHAAALEMRVVEFATVAGELSPSSLSGSGRRHLARLVDGLGMRVTSLVADIPGLRLTDPHTVDEKVARTCQVIELAADMNVPTVTASLGAVTHPDTGEHSPHAIEALRRIGEFADSRGTLYAVSPSHDSGERLVGLFDELACDAIRIGFDPAVMVMTGANPLAAIERFVEKVVGVQARDGSAGGSRSAGREMPMGEGDVDWTSVLATLKTADFQGPYILRRTESVTPIEDIIRARDVLADMV